MKRPSAFLFFARHSSHNAASFKSAAMLARAAEKQQGKKTVMSAE